MPEESAIGWKLILEELKERGVVDIGLIVTDGLKGIVNTIPEVYVNTPLQRCVTHLKYNLLARVNIKISVSR